MPPHPANHNNSVKTNNRDFLETEPVQKLSNT